MTGSNVYWLSEIDGTVVSGRLVSLGPEWVAVWIGTGIQFVERGDVYATEALETRV